MPAYGNDELTKSVQDLFSHIFETECTVFFATTGSAANGLALSQLVPPYGATFCHEFSHVQMDEVGTPEFYTGGAKLLTLPGEQGKLTPEALSQGLKFYFPEMTHHVKPKALSITQGTEAGTVYTCEEIMALTEIAKEFGLKTHMDGARLTNALVHLGCSPAEMTWKAGVDVLCFGATKNGALAAEAIVFFDAADTEDFAWRHKRSGHVWSKNRFMAAQWQAFLKDGLWLKLAGQANAMASRLAEGLRAIEGCEVVYPTQINEVFVTFPAGMAEGLLEKGASFYDWVYPGDRWNGRLKRLVTSYVTTTEEVDAFLTQARHQVDS